MLPSDHPPQSGSEEPTGGAEPETSVIGEIPTLRSTLTKPGVGSEVYSCFTIPLHQITGCKDLGV